MKEIRPEDLFLNSRFVGNNRAESRSKTLYGDNNTQNNCYTGDPCDTVDKCHTDILICDTDAQCKETAKCLQTKYCKTSQCGDTVTKAEICCPLPTTPTVCGSYTNDCRETEQCLISKDICETAGKDTTCFNTGDICETINDCITNETCVSCEESKVCMRPTIIGC